jgi:prepilin-type N-terminal cleavage/methylation domain-containing protein
VPKITGMVHLRTLLRRLRDERGMTLVELLTVMTLLSIVMGAVVVLYISGLRAQGNMTSKFNAQTMLHVGLDRIRADLHIACSETAQSGTSVTLSFPPCDGSKLVTWCTRGSGTPVVYALYRQVGATCTAGQQFADFLTGGSIFSYLGPNNPTGSYALARLHLDITVNATPLTSGLAYHVVDDDAFGNSVRQ